MSEEKKAIEMLRNYDNEDNLHKIHQSINVLLNLIEKQQKEIDELQSYIKEYLIPKSTINLLYVSKDKIKELREIDNIDLIQFKIRELLEERN